MVLLLTIKKDVEPSIEYIRDNNTSLICPFTHLTILIITVSRFNLQLTTLPPSNNPLNRKHAVLQHLRRCSLRCQQRPRRPGSCLWQRLHDGRRP